MKYKIEKNTRSLQTEYFVMYKKNPFSRWRYVKNKFGLTSHWISMRGAEVFIRQEKIRLGLKD